MSRNTISVGEVRVGRVLTQDEDGLPDQAATMTFDEEQGVELHLPYFVEEEDSPNPHYARAHRWFGTRETELPKVLLFQDNRGSVMLTGTRISGMSGRGRAVGRVRADTVIFSLPRSWDTDYGVAKLVSTIDGLEEFADFRPVTHDTTFDDEGKHRTTVTVHANEAVSWPARGFEFSIVSNVAWQAVDGRSFVIEDTRPTLVSVSVSDGGETPHTHVRQQWAVRALLSLLFGKRTPFRSHEIFDDEFPQWSVGGGDFGPYNVKTLLSSTVRYHSLPPANRMPRPAFRLHDIGAEGMRVWMELYGDPRFERAVRPAVEVINGVSAFVEPQIMMLAISLDRFGDYRYNDGRQRAIKTMIKRCLDDSGFDWSRVGTNDAIAAAIANVNNDLKHPNRKEYPSNEVLVGVTRLARVIVRAQLFDLLKLGEDARQSFMGSAEVRQALDYFARTGLSLGEDGRFSNIVPEPDE